MLKAMHKDVLLEVQILQSDLVQDSPFSVIETLSSLRKKWYKIFEKNAKAFIKWLANRIGITVKNEMKKEMGEATMTIEPHYTEKDKDIISKIIEANVKLIKSIPQKYLKEVQKIIKEAWLRGGDRKYIFDRIVKLINKKAYPNADRRAYLIAKDQMNKITQQWALHEAKAYGATRGQWIHVPGEFSSRETHIHMNKQPFDLNVGLYDEAVKSYVLPAELPYCACQFRALFPGME